MKNKVIDLFCGCGGLSYGFEMAGFEVSLAIDMWNDAIKTYNHNNPSNVGMCIDIKDIDDEYLEIKSLVRFKKTKPKGIIAPFGLYY